MSTRAQRRERIQRLYGGEHYEPLSQALKTIIPNETRVDLWGDVVFLDLNLGFRSFSGLQRRLLLRRLSEIARRVLQSNEPMPADFRLF